MFEPVLTMTDYYDGPRGGIAFYNGTPHLYKSRLINLGSDIDDIFFLMPLASKIVELALEDWAIWKRWRTAFDQGKATLETHPALPKDRIRHYEISAILQSELLINEEKSFCAKAKFKPADNQKGLLVEWELVSCEADSDQGEESSL